VTSTLVLVESNTTGTGPLFAAAARGRGVEPLLVTATPERYPWAAGSGTATVEADTSDPADVARACLEVIGGAAPAGVVSSSEYFVATAAEVARGFGLAGPAPRAVRRCRDKAAQRAVLRAAGLPVARTWVVKTATAAVRAAADLGYPVVCKPADGTGSRGVRLCSDPSAVRSHVEGLLAGPAATGRALIEEFVGGPEVSVETFGSRALAVVDKHVGPLPCFVEYGHDIPSRLCPADQAAVMRVAVEAVAALGLGWGPAHTEIRLAPAGPVVIEVNPRLAGGLIPVLIEQVSGCDLVQATVDLAVGRPGREAPEVRPHQHASIRFVVAPERASVTGPGDEAAARAVPGVVDVSLAAAPGDRVGGTGSFLDRIGWAIATGPTAAVAADAAATAAGALTPELRPVGATTLLAGAS
jgi:argininosuccinate lyase